MHKDIINVDSVSSLMNDLCSSALATVKHALDGSLGFLVLSVLCAADAHVYVDQPC